MHAPGGHAPHVVTSGHPWDSKFEILIAVLLGLAAIAGAFAAYQREGHEHEAQAAFTRASIALTASAQQDSSAQQILALDSLLFVEYMVRTGDKREADNAGFLHDRVMDTRLRKATDWWVNHSYQRAGNTPFNEKNPYWKLPEATRAQEHAQESRNLLEEGRHEQSIGDSYTRVEVVLATALFLLGVAGVTRNFRIRLGGMGMGIAIFFSAIGMLVTV